MFNDENDFQSRRDKLHEMPLFKKGQEIVEVITQIADLIPEDDEVLQTTMSMILRDAYLLTAKIANAESGEFYDIKMQNAAIIRKAAMDLIVSYHSLKMHGFEHADYYLMVRGMLEEYRLLFVDWVDGFDKNTYLVDRWNMFNPPGVHYTDEDPDLGWDDDDDFDINDFFGDDEEDDLPF
jgi:hypothetical protein